MRSTVFLMIPLLAACGGLGAGKGEKTDGGGEPDAPFVYEVDLAALKSWTGWEQKDPQGNLLASLKRDGDAEEEFDGKAKLWTRSVKQRGDAGLTGIEYYEKTDGADYALARKKTYTYGEGGRLKAYAVENLKEAAKSYKVDVSYTPDGKDAGYVRKTGDVVTSAETYTYDAHGRLAKIETQGVPSTDWFAKDDGAGEVTADDVHVVTYDWDRVEVRDETYGKDGKLKRLETQRFFKFEQDAHGAVTPRIWLTTAKTEGGKTTNTHPLACAETARRVRCDGEDSGPGWQSRDELVYRKYTWRYMKDGLVDHEVADFVFDHEVLTFDDTNADATVYRYEMKDSFNEQGEWTLSEGMAVDALKGRTTGRRLVREFDATGHNVVKAQRWEVPEGGAELQLLWEKTYAY